jgi:hypothetical protein
VNREHDRTRGWIAGLLALGLVAWLLAPVSQTVATTVRSTVVIADCIARVPNVADGMAALSVPGRRGPGRLFLVAEHGIPFLRNHGRLRSIAAKVADDSHSGESADLTIHGCVGAAQDPQHTFIVDDQAVTWNLADCTIPGDGVLCVEARLARGNDPPPPLTTSITGEVAFDWAFR